MTDHLTRTAGPWTIDRSWGDVAFIKREGNVVTTTKRPRPHAEGNLALLSSAPLLLAALADLLDCHVAYCGKFGPGVSDDAMCIDAARTALARARGETP